MLYRSSPVSLTQRDRSVDIGEFVVTETVRGQRLTLPWHFHENTNISFVISGNFIESVGKRTEECSSSSLIIRPAGEAHFNRYSDSETRSLIIEVKPRRLEALQAISRVLESACHIRKAPYSVLAWRIYKEFRFLDSASPLAIEALVLEILTRLSRLHASHSASKAPTWLLEARDLLHDDFAKELSLSSVAEKVRIHPAHLARVFRKHFHCTVGEYLRRLRLDDAARQLMDVEKPVAGIALATGFYDQSHLTHAFKLHLGMTPSEFRSATKSYKPGTKKPLSSKTS